MQFCLSHPTYGYYSKGDVFGRKGDFITSPEISQIFGELVAVYLLTRYLAAGSPGRIRVVELGPGRGTLMDDVLRVSPHDLELLRSRRNEKPAAVKMKGILGDQAVIKSEGGSASISVRDELACTLYDPYVPLWCIPGESKRSQSDSLSKASNADFYRPSWRSQLSQATSKRFILSKTA